MLLYFFVFFLCEATKLNTVFEVVAIQMLRQKRLSIYQYLRPLIQPQSIRIQNLDHYRYSSQNIFCQFLSKTFHKPKLPEVQKSFFIGQILFVWASLSCASEIPKYFTKMFSINNFGNWDSTKKLPPTLGRGLSKIWKNCQRRLKTVIFKFQILSSPNRQMKC